MPNAIEQDIYRTVAYFSYFGYPLTSFEIWKWQLRPRKVHPFLGVDYALHESVWLQKHIRNEGGFFGLPNRHGDVGKQIKTRHDRYLAAIEKHNALKAVIHYLSRLPSVEAVAVCNTLAFHFTSESSDIDLFILTRTGSVWTARLQTVLPFLLLRKRPGEAKRHAIDTNFFVDVGAMDLENLRKADDPYFSVWMRMLVPMFEREEGIFQRFLLQNDWLRTELPASSLPKRAFRYRNRVNARIKPSGRGSNFFEQFAKYIQKLKFPQDIRDNMNKGTEVVVSDMVLKFHKNDTRDKIADYLRERMRVCEKMS